MNMLSARNLGQNLLITALGALVLTLSVEGVHRFLFGSGEYTTRFMLIGEYCFALLGVFACAGLLMISYLLGELLRTAMTELRFRFPLFSKT